MQGNADELLDAFAGDDKLHKGEFVVLIDNPQKENALDQADIRLLQILLQELSVKMAVKIAGRLTGKKKNEIYQLALELREEAESES